MKLTLAGQKRSQEVQGAQELQRRPVQSPRCVVEYDQSRVRHELN